MDVNKALAGRIATCNVKTVITSMLSAMIITIMKNHGK